MKIYEIQTRYVAKGVMESVPTFTHPTAVVRYRESAFNQYHDQEQFWVVMLNGANRPIARVMCTLGLANQTQIHPREAFKHAVREGAISVIFLHNHPSGNLKASIDDIATTTRLVEAGKVLDIPVLDHVIVADGWTSIRATNPECFR